MEEDDGPATIGQHGVVVVSVDAFHFPNAQLLETSATLHSGQVAPLKAAKGTPPTMDVAGLVQALHLLSDDRGTTRLPYYDRQAHDPRPAGPLVTPEARLVIVEGIHLLHTEGQWAELRGLLTCCIHLDTSSTECRKRLIERKSAPGAGRSVAEATAHYELVDRQNLRAHQFSRGLADLVVQLRPGTFEVLSATKGGWA
jgi:pantothenate kinase